MAPARAHRDRSSRSAGARALSRTGIVPFAGGIAGIALALVGYYVWTWRSLAGFTAAVPPFTRLFCDFVDYYYPMGEAVFRTGLPVSGFLYSPFIALLLAVFPPLGLNASLVVWGVLQALSVLLYLALFRRLVPAGLPIQLLFVFLALSSYPLVLNVMGGQVSVFVTVALLGMLVFDEGGHRAGAASLLACATGFKFYPVLFVVPFAVRRGSRFLLFAVAACGLLLFVVPALLLGAGDTLRFYGALLDSFRDSVWVVANPHSQFLPHVVLRLAEAAGHDVQAQLPLLRWIAYGLAVANMGLVLLVQRARQRHADLWSFQLVFLTVPFVLKTSWPHDFVFLPFTQALLAWRLLGGEEETATEHRGWPSDESGWRGRISGWRSAALLFLVLTAAFLSNIVFFNLFGDFRGYGFRAYLFLADVLLLVVLYLELLPPALRRLRAIREAVSGPQGGAAQGKCRPNRD